MVYGTYNILFHELVPGDCWRFMKYDLQDGAQL